nr:ATP-binding protein [Pseudomonadota bacterium]
VTVSVDQSKHILRLVVADTGVGIPLDKQKEVFERFTRVSHAWQGKVRGSGLGLYFVKRIVDRLGGNIDLQSAEGQGSRFTIEIPLKSNDIF